MAHLSLRAVGKTYGGSSQPAVAGIDIEIADGEFIVLVGPSGCGKSTLLRMVAGLETVSAGEIRIGERMVNKLDPAERDIAMVFQNYALYPHMTVRQNMAYGLKNRGTSKAVIAERVAEAARMLELNAYLDRKPRALSGGQRQRVAMGRAIVRQPAAFLFDEPLSNLDAALRVATRIEIAQLKASMPDRTMIYVTHDQTEAMTLADRIVVLAGGGIAQVGAPLELYERPVNEFVAQFIGSPAMNLLPGKVTAVGEMTGVALDGGGQAQVAIPTRPGDEGMEINLGVRPEDMRETDGTALFEGKVDLTEALGEVTLLYFGTQGGAVPIIAKLSGIHPGLKGSTVRLTADPQALHLFHKGNSLLYRDGTDLPPYQPRTARAAGSMGGDRGAAAMPADRNGQDRNGGRDGEDGDRIEDGLIKPEGPVR